MHAVGATVVVDDGEPRLPFAGLRGLGLDAGGFDGGSDGGGVHPGDVAAAHVHAVGLDLGRLSAVEAAEYEMSGAVSGRDATLPGGASDGEPFVEQRGEGGQAFSGGEWRGTVALIEDDAESGLILDRHANLLGQGGLRC